MKLILSFFLIAAAALTAQSPATRKLFTEQQQKNLAAPAPAVNPLLQPMPALPRTPAAPANAPARRGALPEAQLLTVAEAFPELEFAPDFNTALDWSSRHMREGWARNDRPVGIGQAELSERGGYLGVFAVYDFNDRLNRKWRFEESRFYAGISGDYAGEGSHGPLSFDFSWAYLYYPKRTRSNSAEISADLAMHEFYKGDDWFFGLGVTLIHDYELEESTIAPYLEFSQRLNASGTLNWDAVATLYWGDTKKVKNITDGGCGSSAFYASTLKVSLHWEFAQGWRLSPYAAISAYPDRRARNAAKVSEMNCEAVFWGGLRLTRTF